MYFFTENVKKHVKQIEGSALTRLIEVFQLIYNLLNIQHFIFVKTPP